MAALTVRVPSPGPEVSPFKDRVWQTPASAADDKDSPRWVKPSSSGDAATPQMTPSPPATPGTGSARKKKGRRVRRPRSAASPASSPWLAHRVHRPSSASGGRSARRSVGKSGPRSPTTRSVRRQLPPRAAAAGHWRWPPNAHAPRAWPQEAAALSPRKEADVVLQSSSAMYVVVGHETVLRLQHTFHELQRCATAA